MSKALGVMLASIFFVSTMLAIFVMRDIEAVLHQEAADLRASIPQPLDLARLEASIDARLAAYRPPDLTPAMADLKAMREMVEGAIGQMRRMESDVGVLQTELRRAKMEAWQVVQDADSHIRLIEDILMTAECLEFDAALFTPFGLVYLGPIEICGQNLGVRNATN